MVVMCGLCVHAQPTHKITQNHTQPTHRGEINGAQNFDKFVSAVFHPMLPGLQEGKGIKTRRGNRGGRAIALQVGVLAIQRLSLLRRGLALMLVQRIVR